MRQESLSVLAVLAAAASLCAQGGELPRGGSAPLPYSADNILGLDSFRSSTPAAQDPDYTMRGLFQQAHGEFMLKRERFDPKIKFTGEWMPTMAVDGEEGHFDLTTLAGDIEIPLMVSTDAYINVGAYGEGRSYDMNDFGGTTGVGRPAGDEILSAVGAKLGVGWFASDDMLVEIQTEPGVWSDLDGTLHSDDYRFYSKALLTWRTGDEFFFKIGARYNEIYEEAPYLPYLGFSWAIGETMRLDVLLPETAEFSFWPSGDTGFLFGVDVGGGRYEVRTTEANGSTRDETYVQEIIVYGGVIFRLSDAMSLDFRGGAVVAGDYKWNTGEVGFDTIEGTLEPAAFVSASIGFDF